MDINIQTENSSLYLHIFHQTRSIKKFYFTLKDRQIHIEGFKGLDAGREDF